MGATHSRGINSLHSMSNERVFHYRYRVLDTKNFIMYCVGSQYSAFCSCKGDRESGKLIDVRQL